MGRERVDPKKGGAGSEGYWQRPREGMIDLGDIVDLLEKDPFRPFRIHTSDGYAFELMNPAFAVATETALFVVLPHEGWKLFSYQQMTRVESVEVAV